MFRGRTPWRDNPTDRQKVISERYALHIKEETGKLVDPEIIRAVRYTLLRHSERAIFDSPDELKILTAHAKHQRRRAYAMELLRQADQELSALLNGEGDDDDWNDDEF